MSSTRKRSRRPLLAFSWVALSGVVLASTPVLAQTVAGSVVAVSGAVVVQRGADKIPPKPGSLINEYDRLTTGSRGRITVAFGGHDQMMLGESSVAVIEPKRNAPSARTQITLVSGIVRTITSSTDAASNFEVSTPNAVVVARAGRTDTSFDGISRRRGFPSCDRITDVSVLDGAAQVKNGPPTGGDFTSVPAGYVSTVACGATPTNPGPLGVAESRTLNVSSGGSGGFLYTFFHDSSPTVEQEDIEGVPNGVPEDDPPSLFAKRVQPLGGTRLIRPRANIPRGPIRIR
jgi:hypothetical protein